MKLSKKTIKKIKSDRSIIYDLAIKKKVHSGTIDRQLDENKNDGPLTLVSTVTFLSERTGLTKEEILCK